MSFFGDIYDDVYSAVTGNVAPGTKAALISGAQADIAQAAGPDASPDYVATLQAGQASAITSFLDSIGADPSQSGLRTPLGLFGGSDAGLGCAESDAAGTSCKDGLAALRDLVTNPFQNLIAIAIIGGGVVGGVLVFNYLREYLRKAGVK